jgi:NADH dehydrogenase [ubiquinone] 1 alpha subcomplex assembly factor 7
MDADPATRIRAEIDARGPITFARYMELALYGDGGYYDAPPVGTSGDFVTSPHVHPVFASLVGVALREHHDALGRPDPLLVTEVGAGDGTLARGLLDACRDLPVRYTAVEVSAGARAALRQTPGVDAVHEELTEPFDLLLANELLDNLPFRIVRDGVELGVGLDDTGAFVQTPLPGLDDAVARAHAADAVVPTGALAFVERVATMLHERPGYALLIDYALAPDVDLAVHGYAAHRPVADVLNDPGRVDITAGVDLDLVGEHGRASGATVFPHVTQRAALTALGFGAWLEEELATQQRQLAANEGIDAVRTWSGRSRATLLVDPGALGRHRWLVLASPDLPEPPWLGRARALG